MTKLIIDKSFIEDIIANLIPLRKEAFNGEQLELAQYYDGKIHQLRDILQQAKEVEIPNKEEITVLSLQEFPFDQRFEPDETYGRKMWVRGFNQCPKLITK